MTDWSAILAQAFETTVQKCGDGGDSGDRPAKALGLLGNSPRKLVTSRNTPVVTVGTPRNDDAVTTVTTASLGGGDKGTKDIPSISQEDRRFVTTVTTVTTDIHSLAAGVFDRLRSMPPPESFGAETWRQLLVDADAFFHCWAEPAELLAW